MKLARVLLPIKDKESVCIVTNLVRRNCRFSDEVDGDGEGYGSARHVVERDGDFLRAAEITIVAAPVCFPVANAGVAGANLVRFERKYASVCGRRDCGGVECECQPLYVHVLRASRQRAVRCSLVKAVDMPDPANCVDQISFR